VRLHRAFVLRSALHVERRVRGRHAELPSRRLLRTLLLPWCLDELDFLQRRRGVRGRRVRSEPSARERRHRVRVRVGRRLRLRTLSALHRISVVDLRRRVRPNRGLHGRHVQLAIVRTGRREPPHLRSRVSPGCGVWRLLHRAALLRRVASRNVCRIVSIQRRMRPGRLPPQQRKCDRDVPEHRDRLRAGRVRHRRRFRARKGLFDGDRLLRRRRLSADVLLHGMGVRRAARRGPDLRAASLGVRWEMRRGASRAGRGRERRCPPSSRSVCRSSRMSPGRVSR